MQEAPRLPCQIEAYSLSSIAARRQERSWARLITTRSSCSSGNRISSRHSQALVQQVAGVCFLEQARGAMQESSRLSSQVKTYSSSSVAAHRLGRVWWNCIETSQFACSLVRVQPIPTRSESERD